MNFVPSEVNKVSYATSFGLKNIRENQKAITTSFLNRIQYLSCREQSGVQIIENLTHRDAKLVCDPTLLLTRAEWDKYVCDDPIVKGDYVFTYLLSNNIEHRKYARKLAEATGCKVVGVLHGSGYVKGDERFVDEAPKNIGPFEFLNLIKYAKYVCTDSFHGCVFSTIYDLLERFGLINRLVEHDEELNLNKINYESVNYNVQQFREESRSFLIRALEKGEI